jgi:hypothetical protein
MIRTALFSSFFALLLLAQPVFAQTCTPTCSSGTHCVYTGSGADVTQTGCIPNITNNGTVNEVIVTGTGHSSLTFADIVYTKIVPFVNNLIIPLLYILAFLFFIFGTFRYFFTGGEENREKGRAFILWSLIGMVAIFGVWGIVKVLLTIIPGA